MLDPTETHHFLTTLADLEPGPRSCKSYHLCPLTSPAMAKISPTHHPLAHAVLVMALAMALAVQETQAQCPSNDLASCLPAAKADIQPTEECCANLAAYTATDTPGECICEGALSSPLAGDDDVNVQYAVLIPQKCALLYPAGTTCRGEPPAPSNYYILCITTTRLESWFSLDYCAGYVIPGGQ
jgi:hypothetical protein